MRPGADARINRGAVNHAVAAFDGASMRPGANAKINAGGKLLSTRHTSSGFNVARRGRRDQRLPLVALAELGVLASMRLGANAGINVAAAVAREHVPVASMRPGASAGINVISRRPCSAALAASMWPGRTAGDQPLRHLHGAILGVVASMRPGADTGINHVVTVASLDANVLQ